MQYAERMVNSMEELPCYSGVEHEVTPLGSGHSLAKIQSATAKKAGFYKETFFNRLRYKEVQT